MSDGIKKIVVNLDALQMKAPKKQTRKLPTIVPNKLKDTFLKQVQHHKSLANAQKQKAPAVDPVKYTDDFNSSVEYLNNIKKNIQPVHSDLPLELMETTTVSVPNLVPKLVEPYTPPPATSLQIASTPAKYAVDSAVPYGCLKNGIKPSFKNWTRSNRPTSSHSNNNISAPSLSFNNEPSSTSSSINSSISNKSNIVTSTTVTPQPPPTDVPTTIVATTAKQATTIKRHVIGKSKKSRHVGVLIKNVNTRKMIINAHKDLKKININEVRNHLKNNGLLKVGTTAPIDVLRQTYEASILAGNINNKNGETLYHNFVNDTKEI
jgi:hypothetical protein